MKYGIYLPNYGEEADPRALADLASEAETAGWDGFFLWDHILVSNNDHLSILDPWITLAAMASQTNTIRLGTTVTPLPRRRPWKLARETTTLDHLSRGRLTLGVGLGFPGEIEYGAFGEDADARNRAVRLDEGLEILTGLWRGKSFKFQGNHYQVKKATFLPTPIQKPRIPIWVGGFWPNQKPFERAARWDGVIPLKYEGRMTPADARQILDFIHSQRKSDDPFDLVIIGSSYSRSKGVYDKLSKIRKFAEVGTTWWLESFFLERNSVNAIRQKIVNGPPKY